MVGLGLAVVLLTYIALGAWAVLGLRRYPGWVSGTEAAAGAPMNILLIGTDAAGGQPGRADTLVIAHLPADRSAIYLVSVPRSTQAALPQGVVQLKTARLIGGVPLTVQAVEQVTGVTIDHVVETDFEGLAALADAVGGVTVTNPQASIADGELPMPAGDPRSAGPDRPGLRPRPFGDRRRAQRAPAGGAQGSAGKTAARDLRTRSRWPDWLPDSRRTSVPTTACWRAGRT